MKSNSTSDSLQANSHFNTSPRRKWLFRLLAVAMSLAPLLLLEFALRLSGYGYDTNLVVPVPYAGSGTKYTFNAPADRAYHGTVDLSGPEPRPFEMPKPDGVYRVVVVGGSTVAGFPYPFELALPRHLELILEHQLPEMRFEVLNAGITSINSFSEVDIVRQAVACDPDLIVVHSGHNEFYGPGGSASKSSGLTPALYPILQSLRRQRSFQLALSLVPKPPNSHLIETLPADIAIPLDGEVFHKTQARYRQNLKKIVGIAKRSRLPMILSTVPSNLRDLSPMQTDSNLTLAPRQAEEQASRLKEAMRHISYRKFDLALEKLTEARRVDPAHPLLAYRQAQCLEMLERRDDAAATYALAADLDGCRFRATSSFANVVREVAQAEAEGVYFCDVAAQFQNISQFPAPGRDLFLEHVHYNLEGHWQAARCLAECVVADVLGKAWNAARLPDERQRDELLFVTPFDHLVADAQITGILEVWPLSLSPVRREETELVQDRWRSTYATLAALDQELFTSQTLESMTQNVLLVMGHAFLSVGEEDRALAFFQRQISRRPWDPSGYVGAVLAYRELGKLSDERDVLQRVRQIAPNDPQVQALLERVREE
ncbi:MAG: tetratricopeptide repeat protein [Pirellulaceae bacterium]